MVIYQLFCAVTNNPWNTYPICFGFSKTITNYLSDSNVFGQSIIIVQNCRLTSVSTNSDIGISIYWQNFSKKSKVFVFSCFPVFLILVLLIQLTFTEDLATYLNPNLYNSGTSLSSYPDCRIENCVLVALRYV